MQGLISFYLCQNNVAYCKKKCQGENLVRINQTFYIYLAKIKFFLFTIWIYATVQVDSFSFMKMITQFIYRSLEMHLNLQEETV